MANGVRDVGMISGVRRVRRYKDGGKWMTKDGQRKKGEDNEE
jgi:hypothetical protein